LNPAYLLLVALQTTGLLRFKTEGVMPRSEQSFG
jgi:hypothetical protein